MPVPVKLRLKTCSIKKKFVNLWTFSRHNATIQYLFLYIYIYYRVERHLARSEGGGGGAAWCQRLTIGNALQHFIPTRLTFC